MPTHQYIITILGDTCNSQTITKFTQEETDICIKNIKKIGLNCSVQKLRMHFEKI
jgi:hypothetical protein